MAFKHTQLAYSLHSLHLLPLTSSLKPNELPMFKLCTPLPPFPPEQLSLRPLKSCKSPTHWICFSPCATCLVTAFNSVDHFHLLQIFSSLNLCNTLLCSPSNSVDTSQPPFQAPFSLQLFTVRAFPSSSLHTIPNQSCRSCSLLTTWMRQLSTVHMQSRPPLNSRYTSTRAYSTASKAPQTRLIKLKFMVVSPLS